MPWNAATVVQPLSSVHTRAGLSPENKQEAIWHGSSSDDQLFLRPPVLNFLAPLFHICNILWRFNSSCPDCFTFFFFFFFSLHLSVANVAIRSFCPFLSLMLEWCNAGKLWWSNNYTSYSSGWREVSFYFSVLFLSLLVATLLFPLRSSY